MTFGANDSLAPRGKKAERLTPSLGLVPTLIIPTWAYHNGVHGDVLADNTEPMVAPDVEGA